MRRPSQQTMVIGQPLIAASLQLFGGGMLILCFCIGMNAFVPGFIACCIVGEATRAAEAVKAYKRWIAVCDEVDGVSVRRRPIYCTPIGITVCGLIAILLVGLLSESGNAAIAAHWSIGLAVVALLVHLIRRMRRGARRSRKPMTVTVVAQCHMRPVPLSHAFALLPEHCQRILARPQS